MICHSNAKLNILTFNAARTALFLMIVLVLYLNFDLNKKKKDLSHFQGLWLIKLLKLYF